MASGRIKEYTAPDVVVGFDARKCIHAARCVRELPEVFDVDARPWISPERADVDRVAEQVARCPTGALTARRPEGGEIEMTPADVTVTTAPNGPLFVRGEVSVLDADGAPLEVGRRVALCRCGASANKPFCDGTHREVGFQG